MGFQPHDQMLQNLIAQGLIDKETGDITPAGHEYVRDLQRRIAPPPDVERQGRPIPQEVTDAHQLAALVIIRALLCLPVVDLYNRTAVLARINHEQRMALHHHHWLLSQVTEKQP